MALLSDLLLRSNVTTWAFVVLPVSFVVYWIGWIIYARTLHPLAKIPGDFWPSVSRTWLMYYMYRGDIEEVQRAYHVKYGPIARIAPDEISVSDPEAVSKIYPVQKPLEKTDWYHAWRPPGLNCQHDMFTETSEKKHSSYRRIVGNVYSLGSILKSEKELDAALDLFVKRCGEFADKDQAFDFGCWLEMYAFDNIGAIFFGEQFGFLEKSEDHGGYMKAVHLAMPFLSVVTMTPVWARPLVLATAFVTPKLLKAVIAVDGIRKTAVKETEVAAARSVESTSQRYDAISQLLNIVHEKGEKVNFTMAEVTSEMWTGIIAGADSTSIALRSVFYHLLKNPEKMRKIRTEIDNAFEDGTLSHPVQYNAAVTLPYLSAVIREASRVFPSFQLTMPRFVPAQGLELCGFHIPAPYRVGMNPAILCKDKTVFGDDAAEFVPERWLEGPERTRTLDKVMINFGAGTRTCSGRHLAMAEIFKVVPELLRRFDYEMIHDGPWKTQNAAFVMQTGMDCKFKRRELF
ncbi:cytochrome P450 [Massarina eburnea CBS 473.64]|uniref:Cytochrome P450 n=1 Tax=Massarina eburnea CBS 473.64 TaxID=1395130 RepID=A0A6A6RJS5_9PLEO|nr:cytochrome P450 [Massarina eburnea CBS 473.64]